MTIREENAIAALEIMSRFAANPKWLIYLPPTMSPSETSQESGLLEHPAEAFACYQRERVVRVVCEEKHMGSRAVVIVCRVSYRRRQAYSGQYVRAYRQYCWPVESIADLKLAPFHLLATQGKTYFDKDHTWQMATLADLCHSDEQLLLATPHLVVDLADTTSVGQAIRWWTLLTGRGGEGMVVKPLDCIARGPRGIVQPAVKCRGPEYQRIIYGPEYDLPDNLERLRIRGLGTKRSLVLREFALGVGALERFVHGEPLRRVHECVFDILALESSPVDPRL